MSQVRTLIAILAMSGTVVVSYATERVIPVKESVPRQVIDIAQRCAQIHIAVGNPQWDPISQLPREGMDWDELTIVKPAGFPLYVVIFTRIEPSVGGHRSTCFLDHEGHQVVLVRYTYADPGEYEIVVRAHEAVNRMRREDLTELFENASIYRYKIDWDWFSYRPPD